MKGSTREERTGADGSAFTYEHPPVRVYLDGKHVGQIARHGEGWRYEPKGKGEAFAGDVFPSLRAVQRSIEGWAGELDHVEKRYTVF